MTIGEVLADLREDFPDVEHRARSASWSPRAWSSPSAPRPGTASTPRPTSSGCATSSPLQRDHYLPLKVIKEHLEALDRGLEPPSLAERPPRCPELAARPRRVPLAGGVRPGRARGCGCPVASCSWPPRSTESFLADLESYGLVSPRPGSAPYDDDALVVARTVGELADYGIEPRHLRAFKTAADREVGLVEQVVAPIRRSREQRSRGPGRRDDGPAGGAVGAPARRPGQGRAARPALNRCCPVLPGAGHGPRAPEYADHVREVDVVGVRVEMPSQPADRAAARGGRRPLPPDLDRRGRGHGDRLRPAGRGAAAAADPRPAEGRARARPASELSEVRITEMRDGVFYAVLVLADGVEVSARPVRLDRAGAAHGHAHRVRRRGPRRGRHRGARRAGGRGGEVPGVPRPVSPGGLRGH